MISREQKKVKNLDQISYTRATKNVAYFCKICGKREAFRSEASVEHVENRYPSVVLFIITKGRAELRNWRAPKARLTRRKSHRTTIVFSFWFGIWQTNRRHFSRSIGKENKLKYENCESKFLIFELKIQRCSSSKCVKYFKHQFILL